MYVVVKQKSTIKYSNEYVRKINTKTPNIFKLYDVLEVKGQHKVIHSLSSVSTPIKYNVDEGEVENYLIFDSKIGS